MFSGSFILTGLHQSASASGTDRLLHQLLHPAASASASMPPFVECFGSACLEIIDAPSSSQDKQNNATLIVAWPLWGKGSRKVKEQWSLTQASAKCWWEVINTELESGVKNSNSPSSYCLWQLADLMHKCWSWYVCCHVDVSQLRQS